MYFSKWPLAKRHLGPAMQWTKRRSHDTDGARGSRQDFTIDVDLAGTQDAGASQSDLAESSRYSNWSDTVQQQDYETYPHQRERLQQHDGLQSDEVSAGITDTMGRNLNESAWDFYRNGDSKTSTNTLHIYPSDDSFQPGQRYQHSTDIYDPYFGEMTSSGRTTGTQQQNRPLTWTQFLLPVIVVSLILLVAVLTLLV